MALFFFSLPPSLGHKFKGENSSDQTVGTRPSFKSDTPFPFSLWAYLWSYVNNLEESRVVTVMVVRGGYGANFARFELDSKCERNHEFYSENTWFEGTFIWNFEAGTHGNTSDISLPLLVLIKESELGSYNKLPIVQTSGLWLLFTPDAGRIPVRKCLFPLSYVFTEGSLPPLALVQYLWTEESGFKQGAGCSFQSPLDPAQWEVGKLVSSPTPKFFQFWSIALWS